MPYKNRGVWHDQCRDWLNTLRPKNTTTERGVVAKRTISRYRSWVTEAGELLNYPNPKNVTLDRMKALEGQLSGKADRSIMIKSTIIRSFFRWCGNQAAPKWRISAHPGPFRGGVFLNERQVSKLHQEAARLGIVAELTISLAVDMGLRTVDINRLTLENARNFLEFQEDDILGKGRNGGKVALQSFSDYTAPILERYLQYRQQLVKNTGDYQNQLLVVREVHWCKRKYLASLKSDHYCDIAHELNDRLNIKFGYHDLRRTLGNRLHKKNYPIETIAKVLRHEDCGMTFRAYIGVDSCDMRDALNSLNHTTCPGTLSQIGT